MIHRAGQPCQGWKSPRAKELTFLKQTSWLSLVKSMRYSLAWELRPFSFSHQLPLAGSLSQTFTFLWVPGLPCPPLNLPATGRSGRALWSGLVLPTPCTQGAQAERSDESPQAHGACVVGSGPEPRSPASPGVVHRHGPCLLVFPKLSSL